MGKDKIQKKKKKIKKKKNREARKRWMRLQVLALATTRPLIRSLTQHTIAISRKCFVRGRYFPA